MMLCRNDFDWSRDDSVLLHPQMGVAVYPNAEGRIVIRQQDDGSEDADTAIVIDELSARILARELLHWADEVATGQYGPFDDPPEESSVLETAGANKPEPGPLLVAMQAKDGEG
jgi:hypothetical protein